MGVNKIGCLSCPEISEYSFKGLSLLWLGKSKLCLDVLFCFFIPSLRLTLIIIINVLMSEYSRDNKQGFQWLITCLQLASVKLITRAPNLILVIEEVKARIVDTGT